MSRRGSSLPISGAGRKRTRADRRRLAAEAACRHLRACDARLARLIGRIGPFRPVLTANPFLALTGAIIHQQVSMSAAATMQRRLKALCPRKRVTPAALLALGDEELRSAGLSRQKTRYLRGLAEAFASGTLSSRKLRRMSDERVTEAVTRLKGVGRWTAEMLLIFCLERPDVWPVDDLGLRRGAQQFLGLAEVSDVAVLNQLAERWRPYRSYATWYLWRSLDGPREPSISA